MPATDQLAVAEERTEPSLTLGTDPGEADTWEIVRVHCPTCDRPIALIGDEERLPQHAVLPTAWHPFSPALCPGSGVPTEDLIECELPEDEAGDALESLLALPAALDWRTQPFSHVSIHRAIPTQR